MDPEETLNFTEAFLERQIKRSWATMTDREHALVAALGNAASTIHDLGDELAALHQYELVKTCEDAYAVARASLRHVFGEAMTDGSENN